MNHAQPSFWHWPPWGHLAHALLLGAAQTLWWVVIYGGANWLTSLHPYRVPIHLGAELHIPFVPVMIFGYFSIALVFLIAPFVLRTRQELHALTAALAVVIFVAGLSFLAVPCELGFPPVPRSADEGVLIKLCAWARWMALPHNMVPSLHVALSAVCLAAYAEPAGPVGKLLLAAWAALIALSTVLTHQHHLLDVATGLALAWAGQHFIYNRWLRPGRQPARIPRASPSTGRAQPA